MIKKQFPEKIYCVLDNDNHPIFFSDLKNCPVYYSNTIRVALYELNYVGKLTTTVTLMKDEDE